MFRFLRQIKDAHGRIESVKEPLFGTDDISAETLTAFGAITAHQYSIHLAEQVRLAQDRIRTNQALVSGGIPWGYVIVGEKYHKKIVPTDLARLVVPGIFQRCIDGDSCMTIAAWLDSEGVPTTRGGRWNEGSVNTILHNMTYAGRRQNEGDLKPNGKPSRKNRETIMECEAVISQSTYDRAQEAMRNRPQRGRYTANPNRPLLTGLKCARCGAPMTRTTSGRKGQRREPYYRCTGSGPQRKGCGNMIHMLALDVIVATRIYAISEDPYKIREWVEGESFDNQIASVKQDIREITEGERWAELPALQTRLAELRERQQHATKGHYEEHETGMTEGEHFDSLDDDGKREYLATHDIRAEKIDNPPLEPGATRGARIVIDGVDHGVFIYPSPRIIHQVPDGRVAANKARSRKS
jgi:Recombinase/Recombinase zinc beta ribbon domain